MSEPKVGNKSPMHNRIQNELIDILLREKKGPIKKEHKVDNQLEEGKFFVIDVADLSNSHPVYYEVEQFKNPSFKAKIKAFANGTGADLVPLYIKEMEKSKNSKGKKLGKNPTVNDLRSWILEQVM